MKAPLYTKKGNKKGELVLNPEIYGARVNHRLLELVRNAYAANLRRGTASTKTRKEVRGGGKKPWRQKGTGRARAGSIRSPIWRGGGTTFGPHPRDYTVHLSRSMRQRALISALSLKGEQKNVFLLEDARLETPKTREWVEIVKSLPLGGKRALCVVPDWEENLRRASGNLRNLMEICTARDLNAYSVLQREKLVITEEALPVLERRILAGEVPPPPPAAPAPKPESKEAPRPAPKKTPRPKASARKPGGRKKR